MAELLIKAVDATHADPEKDVRGCYKRGDIVLAMPDGHEWGAKEGLPTFVIVKVPGLNHTKVQAYLDSAYDYDAELDDAVPVVRRKFRIRVDEIPNAIKRELRDTGSVTVPWTTLRNYLRNKLTDSDETSAEEPR